jgi:hypothetical protein
MTSMQQYIHPLCTKCCISYSVISGYAVFLLHVEDKYTYAPGHLRFIGLEIYMCFELLAKLAVGDLSHASFKCGRDLLPC